MNSIKPKIFDISEKRPQVLLLGNGITHYCGKSIKWDDAIKEMAVRQYDETLKRVPYTIQASMYFDVDDINRHNSYSKQFDKEYYNNSCKPDIEIMDKLFQIKSDAILTTNYTYEFENYLKPNYIQLKNESKGRYAYITSDKENDNKYLLRTFNRITKNNYDYDFWHIHGEMRRKSSVIFTHDEYARLIEKILAYNSNRGNAYSDFSEDVYFKSWIDYFILGDLYIIGLGFDFSEFDLWWLLNRRLREKTGMGKVYFFEPKSSKELVKINALQNMGVITKDCGIEFEDDNEEANNELYRPFYIKALDSITDLINKQNTEETK